MVRVSFRFTSCHFQFLSPNWPFLLFYVSTWLVRCAPLWDIELKNGRKFDISAFPLYYSLYIWIGEHEVTKLKKKIFASNLEKRTQKQAQKDMNEMERHKMDYFIFSAMRMRKRPLFCTSSQQGVRALKRVTSEVADQVRRELWRRLGSLSYSRKLVTHCVTLSLGVGGLQ